MNRRANVRRILESQPFWHNKRTLVVNAVRLGLNAVRANRGTRNNNVIVLEFVTRGGFRKIHGRKIDGNTALNRVRESQSNFHRARRARASHAVLWHKYPHGFSGPPRVNNNVKALVAKVIKKVANNKPKTPASRSVRSPNKRTRAFTGVAPIRLRF